MAFPPIALLALGGIALMALRKKPKGEPAVGGACESMGPFYYEGKISGWLVGDGNGGCRVECAEGFVLSADGNSCVPAEGIDHIIDEGQIDSSGGVWYEYRIWRMYSIVHPYVGEILLDDVWTSGPLGQGEAEVRDGLQQMVDSLDLPSVSFDVVPSVNHCEGEIDWSFKAMGYNAADGWHELGGEITSAQNQPEGGRHWCVVEVMEGNVAVFEGRVIDTDNNDLLFKTGPEPDPNIAASKAWYGAINPSGPFPWPATYGLSTGENP